MQRARRRCLSSRSVSRPFPGVGDQGGEQVAVDAGERSCTPWRGRSLRTMTRIPAGQDDRSRSPVMSVTHAPYLTSPYPS
jgi:hypothetical protein